MWMRMHGTSDTGRRVSSIREPSGKTQRKKDVSYAFLCVEKSHYFGFFRQNSHLFAFRGLGPIRQSARFRQADGSCKNGPKSVRKPANRPPLPGFARLSAFSRLFL